MIWKIGIGTALVAALIFVAFKWGEQNNQAKVAEGERQAYKELLEAINDETIDFDDADAVHRELCKLAGLDPASDECSRLRRDSGQP